MESEDEDKPLDQYTWGHNLRLYEQDENQWAAFYSRALNGDSDFDWADPRYYRILRFFRVVKGFYTGDLDLTGRHQRRYESAMKRWNAYSEDVLDLGRMVEAAEISELKGDHPLARSWDEIQTKWHGRTGLFSFESVLRSIDSVCQVIRVQSAPILQRLTLVDLPPEILYEIFLLLRPDGARNLAACCHDLKDVGLRVAFRNRTIQLNVDWDKVPNPVDLPAVPETIKEAVEELKSHVELLQTRKDLAQEMTSMSLKDCWMEFVQRGDWAEEEWFPVYRGLLTSYHTLFSQAVCTTQRLRFLGISFISIDTALVQHLSSLPRLDALSINGCTISDDAQTLLRDCRSWTITNLTLSFTEEDNLSTWYLLLICPNLCNLTIISGDFLLGGPPRSIWDKIAFFPSLKWLSLTYLWEGSLENLLECFMNQPPLQSLTRFKFHSLYGVGDEAILPLIDILAEAPLDILALHGFSGSGLEIFERITTHFPGLVGLALHRRHNERQTRDDLADWPYPSSTYAELFSGFTRLKHFNWNFRTGYSECSPASIVGFEEGFITEEQQMEERLKDQEPVLRFDDAHLVALLFAAHCPTLKTHAVHVRYIASTIDRTASGVVSIRDSDDMERDLVRQHSPYAWNSWDWVTPDPNPISP
ncbi:hypothetical protein BDN72DRAFT_898104 [Pluteus cervinus]|uniref:Uncharacterized protein n=1 Tax=Pluteus cervinus TaxID=181527 RepID=A0ACD3ASG9_9AGAR|nr:hypothetical protein BDN72DRAFT_898104 [Pluteus cervinus]